MERPLDRRSPVPLYHQIAEAIRYRIATGRLRPGVALPPLREAARIWNANLHTIRRAYAELAGERLVATRVPQGTVVLPRDERGASRTGAPSPLDRFLERVITTARETHDLKPEQLVRLLESRTRVPSPTAAPNVFVSECSRVQCVDLAGQLMARWRVTAHPWPIDQPEPPSGSAIIATYFHYRDIARRWPARLPDVRFLAIHPDPSTSGLLGKLVTGRSGPLRVILCEREESMLSSIASDLSRILPADRFRIAPVLTGEPAPWLARRRARDPVLFPPRLWGDLPEKARNDPRAVPLRYVFDSRELDSLGSAMGWEQQ
jgi:DNA-binding transcriptional regulator YhcF (GntR family)